MNVTCRRLLPGLFAHALWLFDPGGSLSANAAESITVPGTSNPWLAGMPPQTVGNHFDVSPGHSPIEVKTVPIVPGSALRFNASGAVKKGPSWPFAGPEGDNREIAGTIMGAENGISDVVAPKNSLLAVFLDSEAPYHTLAPEPLNFSSSASRDYLAITPLLKQVFFIGDGHTSSGAAQRAVVPLGATRLFLGTMDGVGWYNNEGSFAVEVTILNDDREITPPTVTITHPQDFAVFAPGSDIPVEATALDPDGTVARVEFFAGTRSLGSASSPPFNLTWRTVPVGDYVLTAQATDTAGLSALAERVRVVVSDLSGDVAVVRDVAHPEIDKLQEYLFEMGLRTHLFDPSEIAFEALARHKLIIWDDLGRSSATLNASGVTALSRAFTNNIPLCFIGEDLASAATNLSESVRGVWESLVRLQPGPRKAGNGQVTLIDTESQNPITKGRFGTVEPFPDPSQNGSPAVADTQAQVFGLAEGSPVLVGYPRLEGVDLGGPRTFTQTFPVYQGGDATSQQERKELFQNIVCWLIRCSACSAVDLNLRAIGPAGPVRVGEPVGYSLIVRHGGECEATGVIVTNYLPTAARFLSAESEQGSWRHENGAVIFHLGHLAKASETEMKVLLLPTAAGMITNAAGVRLNGPEVTIENNTDEVVTTVQGEARALLTIEPIGGGSYRVSVVGPSERPFRLEATTNLREWTTLTNISVPTAKTDFLDSSASRIKYRFYRLVTDDGGISP